MTKKKSGNVPDWSDLLPELLGEITDRLQLVEDFTAFRSVCTSWRAALSKNEMVAKSRYIPLLLLPGKDDWKVYSTPSRKFLRTVTFSPESDVRVCLEAGFGWFVIVTAGSWKNVNLVNPISGENITLPDFINLPLMGSIVTPSSYSINEAILSANPSDDPHGFVLMVVACVYMAVWRPEIGQWRRVVPRILSFGLGCCRDQFYAFAWDENVWALDIGVLGVEFSVAGARLVVKLPRQLRGDLRKKSIGFHHLVESSDGELLLIGSDGYFGRNGELAVIGIDVMKGECHMKSGLGKDAVFIGSGNPFCVPAWGAVKPNCVYFCYGDDYVRPIGVYNIQDQSFQRFSVGSLVDRPWCQPLWVNSSIIFTE